MDTPIPPDRCVLVVEDTMLVAEMIAEELVELGYNVLGPVARVASARALLRDNNPDGALLDVNLGGEFSFPIARDLAARGVPFTFLTGYGNGMVPQEFRDRPSLGKPFELPDLRRVVEAMFDASAAPRQA